MSKLAIGQPLYHSTISSSVIHNAFYRGEMYDQASDAGKFNINISRRFRRYFRSTLLQTSEILGYRFISEFSIFDSGKSTLKLLKSIPFGTRTLSAIETDSFVSVERIPSLESRITS